MISFIKIIVNRIKNKLLTEFQSELHSYNPIENVFQWFADYYYVLSPNFDDVINNSKITLKRKLIFHINFAIHLFELIKYLILTKYGDPYTLAVLGESIHYVTNNYFHSHILVSMEMTALPCIMYVRYIGDQQLAQILVKISQFDTNRAFNRINYRKVTKKVWLMDKIATMIKKHTKWLAYPLLILYCAISVYHEQPTRYNLVTLAINSIVHWVCMVNLAGRVIKQSLIKRFLLLIEEFIISP